MYHATFKLSTLKSKATRNFNKSQANQKDPSPGDIMIPFVKMRDGNAIPFKDTKGATIRCIITHSYNNYLFGTIINTIPTTRKPKEICLTDAIEAYSWAYDEELSTLAVIEDKNALELAIEATKKQHKDYDRWVLALEKASFIMPETLEEFIAKKLDNTTLYSYYPGNLCASHEIYINEIQFNSKEGNTEYKYRTQYLRSHGRICLEKPLSFSEWIEQNPS